LPAISQGPLRTGEEERKGKRALTRRAALLERERRESGPWEERKVAPTCGPRVAARERGERVGWPG
jgi:hypothetical protein